MQQKGGTLMNKTEDKAYNLIEDMTLSEFQWSNKRTPSKKIKGEFDVDTLTCH